MKKEIREFVLARCQNGQQEVYNKNRGKVFDWNIGKMLSYGVTTTGFPFLVWETTNFGSIQVGPSRYGELEPQSKLRNDARSGLLLNTLVERAWAAEKMAKEIVY